LNSLSLGSISGWFRSLQQDICDSLEKTDGKGVFRDDKWERKGGGGGLSKIMENGDVIEKGGVNFSAVNGKLSAEAVKSLNIGEEGSDVNFFATGISIVIHPFNPMVPIIHMNIRYFELDDHAKWFGGGIDITPIYVDVNEAHSFHRQLKQVCDKNHPAYYEEFKKWADDYFFIKHRNETRGIGGIFFDRLTETDEFSLEDRFDFVKEVGCSFAPLYTGIMNNKRSESYTEEHKDFQMLRRSRYAEFNLVYDRGTKFGLETNGRTESILMSMPPEAKWQYDYSPTPGSTEEETMNLLKKGLDWANNLPLAERMD